MFETLSPTAREIEYACLLAHGFPGRVPKTHLDFEKGNRENAPLDLEFRVTKYESPAINQVALWYLANSTVNYNYLNFTPNITEDQVKAVASPVNPGNTIDI